MAIVFYSATPGSGMSRQPRTLSDVVASLKPGDLELVPDIPPGESRLPWPLIPAPLPCICCGEDVYRNHLCRDCYDSMLEEGQS